MEVSTGSMMSSCESKELNHLGLVAGMYDELRIGQSIDALIPQDMKQRNLTIGQAYSTGYETTKSHHRTNIEGYGAQWPWFCQSTPLPSTALF